MLNKLKSLAILAAIILPSITSAGSPQCENSKRALLDAGVFAKGQYPLQAQTDMFGQLMAQNNNFNLSDKAMKYVLTIYSVAPSAQDLLQYVINSHERLCRESGI